MVKLAAGPDARPEPSPRAPAVEPSLVIIGAGLRPDCLTEEALEQLRGSPRVFLVNLQMEMAEHLSKGHGNTEVLSYSEGSWSAWERKTVHHLIFAIKRHKRISVVLSGHPLIFSFGPRLCALSARLKIAYRVLPSLNIYNEAMTLVEPMLRGRARWAFSAQILMCSAEEITLGRAHLHAGASTLLMNLGTCGMGQGPKAAKPLSDALIKVYGPDWTCFLMDAGSRRANRNEEFPLKDLGQHWDRSEDHSSLFIPLRPPKPA